MAWIIDNPGGAGLHPYINPPVLGACAVSQLGKPYIKDVFMSFERILDIGWLHAAVAAADVDAWTSY